MPASIAPPMSRSKSEILDAAAVVFMTLGSDSASIDDVARQLGATKGRIYHHFPSKAALLAEVCLRAADFARTAVAPVIDETLPAQECLHQMVRAHVPAVLATLPYHKVIVQSFVSAAPKSTTAQDRTKLEQIGQERRRYEDLFRAVLVSGMEAGAFREQNVTVALHSVLLLINAPVFWYYPRKNESAKFVEELARQLADMAVASLQ